MGAARVTADGGSAEYAPTCEIPDAATQLAMISTNLAGIVAEYIAGPVRAERAFALSNSCDIAHAALRLAALRATGFELATCMPCSRRSFACLRNGTQLCALQSR